MIVENVSGNEYEMDLILGGRGPELLDRLETSLADSVAGTLFEPRDSQTQVKVRGVQESDHWVTFLPIDATDTRTNWRISFESSKRILLLPMARAMERRQGDTSNGMLAGKVNLFDESTAAR
jgi:hypothetical protein